MSSATAKRRAYSVLLVLLVVRVLLVLPVLLGPATDARGAGVTPPERRAVLFYTGAVKGTLEPCGCTSDPLGDIARMTGLVRRELGAGAGMGFITGRGMLLDAGNLLYPTAEVPARAA